MLPKEKERPPADDGRPKFGRLLLVLFAAVMLIVLITLATEAYYTN
ncbi:hypothetical protein [Undibacterium aquatile]|uniref:Uncharacterized protein n=1 Tax=Undibacterium aquatile TaxID=1537398 RepID=A0ABR6XHI6_9BURK|nr:hypothetical protein [Undibacterium aquatile]MBC3812205.1 hypothetical protein [Undibacterium aquatile]